MIACARRRLLMTAQGLVPFAVKLNGDLVKKLHARAQEKQAPLDEVVAELLERGLVQSALPRCVFLSSIRDHDADGAIRCGLH